MSIRPEPDAKQHKYGTKAEILGLLGELVQGWDHMGSTGKAEAGRAAIAGIEAGSFSVRIGVTVYTVLDDH